MRYREIIAPTEAKDLSPVFLKKKKLVLGGHNIVLTIERTTSNKVDVSAEVNGECIGSVDFYHNGSNYSEWEREKADTWSAANLSVASEYRRLGIATEMYALATSCGMRIIRSGDGVLGSGGGKLLPDGERFWSRQTPKFKMGQKPKAPNLVWKRPK